MGVVPSYIPEPECVSLSRALEQKDSSMRFELPPNNIEEAASSLFSQTINNTETLGLSFQFEEQGLDDFLIKDWNDPFDESFLDLETQRNITISTSPVVASNPVPEDTNLSIQTSNYTIVHGKRRGMCVDCMSECLYYRGTEGPCTECGCFPAAHLDLDRQPEYNKKRMNHSEDPRPAKRPKLMDYFPNRTEQSQK